MQNISKNSCVFDGLQPSNVSQAHSKRCSIRMKSQDCEAISKHVVSLEQTVLEEFLGVFWVIIMLGKPAMRYFVSGMGKYDRLEDIELHLLHNAVSDIKRSKTISAKGPTL